MRLQIEKIVYGGAGLAHQDEGAEKGEGCFCAIYAAGQKWWMTQLTGKKSGL